MLLNFGHKKIRELLLILRFAKTLPQTRKPTEFRERSAFLRGNFEIGDFSITRKAKTLYINML